MNSFLLFCSSIMYWYFVCVCVCASFSEREKIGTVFPWLINLGDQLINNHQCACAGEPSMALVNIMNCTV